MTWYYELSVTCLTPNTRNAYAIGATSIGSTTWSILLAEVDYLSGKDPWVPGVHLFSVMLGLGSDRATTFLTALIDDDLPRIEYQPDPDPGQEWFMAVETVRAAGLLGDHRP